MPFSCKWAYTRWQDFAIRPSLYIVSPSSLNSVLILLAVAMACSAVSVIPRKKKHQPGFPVTGLPYLLEMSVIVCAVLFEIQAQVEQGLFE